jgi:site-specific recombinase XerD
LFGSEPWNNVNSALANACRKLALPTVCLIDFRRSWATIALDAGIKKRDVIHFLGHSSSKMVDTVYGRVPQASVERAIASVFAQHVPAPAEGARIISLTGAKHASAGKKGGEGENK